MLKNIKRNRNLAFRFTFRFSFGFNLFIFHLYYIVIKNQYKMKRCNDNLYIKKIICIFNMKGIFISLIIIVLLFIYIRYFFRRYSKLKRENFSGKYRGYNVL